MARTAGRYTLHDEIAAGGMATVYLARLRGEQRFARLVAVKVLHAQYSKDEAFRAMFLDEARLAARISHPNVVATLDVLESEGELFLVMDFVQGESLSRLLRSAGASNLPGLPVAVGIVADALEGLHAAHEARDEDGSALGIVHRDVSPQNILVGVDGVSHVADFGVAKAVGRMAEQWSSQETVKGKAGYMAPEQARGLVDRRSDVYASGVVLWEALTGRRLFGGGSFMEIITRALEEDVAPPSSIRPEVPTAIDAVVMKALSRDREQRFATAREMAIALERATPRASAREIGAWVEEVAKESLQARRQQIARLERGEHNVPVGAASHVPTLETAISVLSEPRTFSVVTVAEGRRPIATPPRPRRQLGAWGLGIALLSAVGFLATRVLVPSRAAVPLISQPVAAASEIPGIEPVATIRSPPPVEPAPPSSAPVAAPTATAVQHPVRHAVVPSPVRSAAPAPSATCHLAELPDQDGILHPRMLCQ